MNLTPQKPPRWMRIALILAGVYNLAWGALVVLFPATMYNWGGLSTPPGKPLVNEEAWQCVGMVVGVYGIAYALAARDPYRHWPIVLVGLLGKVLGPIGMANGVIAGKLAWTAAATNLGNDVIWWIPFSLILYMAYRARPQAAARLLTARDRGSPFPATPDRPP